MTIDPRVFRNTMGCFATGITVLTGKMPDGARIGITINSFSSVSLEPPLILFSLDRESAAVAAFEKGKLFVVNVLSETQRDASMAFSSRGDDPFKIVSWTELENGGAQVDDCLATIQCAVSDVHEGGDHLIVIGQVTELSSTQAGGALVYFRGNYAEITQ